MEAVPLITWRGISFHIIKLRKYAIKLVLSTSFANYCHTLPPFEALGGNVLNIRHKKQTKISTSHNLYLVLKKKTKVTMIFNDASKFYIEI